MGRGSGVLFKEVLRTGAIASIILSQALHADEIPRDQYLRFIPLVSPQRIRQTKASASLHLFGDPRSRNYSDTAPRDGIDDRRGRLLEALARRFSPELVRTTTAVPMDFARLMKIQGRRRLWVDEWNVTEAPAKLIGTKSVDFEGLSQKPCPAAPDVQNPDCQLLALLKQFNPESDRNTDETVPAEQAKFSVLYFDFEGTGPESWKQIYRNPLTGELPSKYQGLEMLYVHPLIQQKDPTKDEYRLVLQYWFFYPWDDSGNKHEGDWEHMNVAVTPLSKVGKALTAKDIRSILDRDPKEIGDSSSDPIVIRDVDYYLHQFVMNLNYVRPNLYASDEEWAKQLGELKAERVGQKQTWEEMRARIKTLSTHPKGYIGGDSKGLDLILNAPGPTSQDSHATYPFPGVYKGIGPAGASEEVGHTEDASRTVRFTGPGKITLVPDWERLLPLIRAEAQVREQWAWLVLPIRWGYPAVSSPFAGIISHAETGNLSPVGPSYSTGWNRPGVSGSFSEFTPQRFSGLLPLTPLDSLKNNLGFLNAPLIPLTTIPPFDLFFQVGAGAFRATVGDPIPIFFPTERIPFRFLGIGVGVSAQSLSNSDWVALFANKKQVTEMNAALGNDLINADLESSFADDAVSPFFQVSLDFGERFTTENSIRHSRSDLGVDLLLPGNTEATRIRGQLNFWEYAGSIRYNVLKGSLLPYLKAGFGLSWYRLEKTTLNGVALQQVNSDWVRKPEVFPFKNLFPNTLHIGFGFEWLMIKSIEPLPKGIDYGLKLDFTHYWHQLAPDSFFEFGSVQSAPSISRLGANLVFVASF